MISRDDGREMNGLESTDSKEVVYNESTQHYGMQFNERMNECYETRRSPVKVQQRCRSL